MVLLLNLLINLGRINKLTILCSFNLWTWYISSLILSFFNFSLQCFVAFSVDVLHIIHYIYFEILCFQCYYKWYLIVLIFQFLIASIYKYNDSCSLTWYLVTLLIYLVASIGCFLFGSFLNFFMSMIIFFENKDNFTSSFLIDIPCLTFLVLLHWLEPPVI